MSKSIMEKGCEAMLSNTIWQLNKAAKICESCAMRGTRKCDCGSCHVDGFTAVNQKVVHEFAQLSNISVAPVAVIVNGFDGKWLREGVTIAEAKQLMRKERGGNISHFRFSMLRTDESADDFIVVGSFKGLN